MRYSPILIAWAAFAQASPLASCQPAAPTSTPFNDHSHEAVATLLSMHNAANGLWSSAWWGSANSLATVADYQAVNDDPEYAVQAQFVYESTFTNAQTTTSNGFGQALTGFRNMFYDDMGWWALGWIKVYDVTGNQTYLDMAESIFQQQQVGISTQCGGGIYWSTDKKSMNAISTGLFISTAAHLANRVSAKKQYYLQQAQTQWKWMVHSGLFTAQGSLLDEIDATTCKAGGNVWSYNQGVILGGLLELNKATGESGHITEANHIAQVFIDAHNKDGILWEWCDPGCEGATVSIFKGVFTRNLAELVRAYPSSLNETIMTNAQAVWNNAHLASGQFRPLWTPDNQSNATYSSTTAGVDAIVAAVVATK